MFSRILMILSEKICKQISQGNSRSQVVSGRTGSILLCISLSLVMKRGSYPHIEKHIDNSHDSTQFRMFYQGSSRVIPSLVLSHWTLLGVVWCMLFRSEADIAPHHLRSRRLCKHLPAWICSVIPSDFLGLDGFPTIPLVVLGASLSIRSKRELL